MSDTIIATDPGRHNSVACAYDRRTRAHTFRTLDTTPADLDRFLARHKGAPVVIEACANAGWVHDRAVGAGHAVKVANTAAEAWKFKHLKRKTDRDDALRLAELEAIGQLPTVVMPDLATRQRRTLIAFRQELVGRRVACQNRIRALFAAQGLATPRGHRAWTVAGLAGIEQHARPLMAPDFGRFVAELSAHFPAAPGAPQPRRLLDRWLPVALDAGLDPIPADVLTQLLRHPTVLAAFRERIVADGGAYWDEVAATSDDPSGVFERGKRSLERVLSADAAPRGEAIPTAGPKAVPSGVARRTGGRGYKVWALVSTGVAACLAVAAVLQTVGRPDDRPVPKAQIAWGWGKPGGLATAESNPKDYLNKLAADAEEWSLHRPGDASGVGTRIAEFRLGCTRLTHSTYGPLAPDDRAWLLERCREWAKVLDGHQQALDAGADPLTVRAAVDEAVRVIAGALREKAKRVG